MLTPCPRHSQKIYSDAELRERYPYFMQYRDVLLDPAKNLAFRIHVIRAVRKNRNLAKTFWLMCSRDLLFYVSAFMWTYRPKDRYRGKYEKAPFIPYPFQIHALAQLQDVILDRDGLGRREARMAKSRDLGATYMCLYVIQHCWHFRENFSAQLVSRVENLVDDTTNMAAMFPKLRWHLKHLPSWMRPQCDTSHMKLYNEDNGSLIHGSSTTGNVGHGNRDHVVLLDEFDRVPSQTQQGILAGVRDSAGSRIYNSTYGDEVGSPFERMDKSPTIAQMYLHWSAHPEKAVGLYHEDERTGRIELIDKEWWLARANSLRNPDTPPYTLDQVDMLANDASAEDIFDYRFHRIQDDPYSLRSPWRDARGEEAGETGRRLIAQQLEMDKAGTTERVFPPTLIDTIKQGCRLGVRGRLIFDERDIKAVKFAEDKMGPLVLWLDLTDGKPAADVQAVMGIDVSVGTGASNSDAVVVCRFTGQELAELTSANMSVPKFATYCIALAHWFNRCKIGWERNGPGGTFGHQVRELHYGHFYTEVNDSKQNDVDTDKPGFWSTPNSKTRLFIEYLEDLFNGQYVIRNEESVYEHECYVYEKRVPVFRGSSDGTDSGGASDLHGDRVVSRALANRLRREMPGIVKKAATRELPENCVLKRFLDHKRIKTENARAERLRSEGWWHQCV